MDDTKRFLTALFGDIAEGQLFYVWSLPAKRTRWYHADQIDAAVTDIATLSREDVYVGVALSDHDRGAKRRVEPRHASGIVGLWADVDYLSGGAHAKSGLPPDERAATKLIAALGLKPTTVVHSGHGLQAWWLFREPWMFDDQDERDAAAALANRWNLTLRMHAAEQGWVVDSTFDLSRVMRVPGTTNYKEDPTPTKLVNLSARRLFNPSDFDDYLADESIAATVGARAIADVGKLKLTASAQPDVDKLSALLENDRKFASSWNRTRKDLTDDSASSYDLSLASIAAACDWTDQEITDLLIASRRRHQDDLKLRQDYYARTIAKARSDAARSLASEEIEVARDAVAHADVVGDRRSAQRGRKELLDHISTMLGIHVVRFVKFTADPPKYRMETTLGNATLGRSEDVMTQRTMSARIVDATRHLIPKFKDARWRELSQAIFTVAEDEDTGIEATDEGLAYSWLTEYLQDRPILDDRNVAAETSSPFRDDGNGPLCFFGPSLRKWLTLSRNEKVTPQRMGEVLRSFGCDHTVVGVVVGSTRTTRSVWTVHGLNVTPDPHARGRLVVVPDDPESGALGAAAS